MTIIASVFSIASRVYKRGQKIHLVVGATPSSRKSIGTRACLLREPHQTGCRSGALAAKIQLFSLGGFKNQPQQLMFSSGFSKFHIKQEFVVNRYGGSKTE